MERRKRKKINIPSCPRQWGLKEMEKDLLESGAVEITLAMTKKEPYQHIIAKIKYDLAQEC